MSVCLCRVCLHVCLWLKAWNVKLRFFCVCGKACVFVSWKDRKISRGSDRTLAVIGPGEAQKPSLCFARERLCIDRLPLRSCVCLCLMLPSLSLLHIHVSLTYAPAGLLVWVSCVNGDPFSPERHCQQVGVEIIPCWHLTDSFKHVCFYVTHPTVTNYEAIRDWVLFPKSTWTGWSKGLKSWRSN